MNYDNFESLDLSKSYTFADYLLFTFKEKVEIIKGKIFEMSPAPSTLHQQISWNLTGTFWQILKAKSCRAFAAPYDVYLIKETEEQAIVQPDICVVCDTNKIKEHGCVGSPDLIIEILSPGNSRRELKTKFELYQENKVQEYWIIYPLEQSIHRYILDEKKLEYIPQKPNTVGDEIDWRGNKLLTDDIFLN